MNQMKIHQLITMALKKIELGESKESIAQSIRTAAEELGIGDPFAGEIDEFLAEKQKQNQEKESAVDPGDDNSGDLDNVDAPQEEVEEKAEEETGYQKSSEPVHPQEKSEDKVEEESVIPDVDNEDPQDTLEDLAEENKENSDEDRIEELEDKQEDVKKEIDKLEQQTEDYVESALRRIAAEAKSRGYRSLSNRFIKASIGGTIEILNNLLMQEYLQRDVYVNYIYLFEDGSAEKSYLANHFKDESYRVEYLQKAIVQLGGTPTTNRLSIPPISDNTCSAVINLNAELEKQSVAEYLSAAASLDGMSEYASLKNWLESVAREEKEDKEDMDLL